MMLPGETRTRRHLVLLFSLPLAFSVVFFAVTLLTEHADIELLRSQSLSSNIGQLRTSVTDIETGEQGFLLTGQDRALLPLKQADSALGSQTQSSSRYAEDEPKDIRDDVQEIVRLARERMNQAHQVLKVQAAEGFGPALQAANSGDSESTMNKLRLATGQLQAVLTAQQARDLNLQRTLNYLSFGIFVTGAIVMLLLMLWIYNELLSYVSERDAAHARLQEANVELEARVEERTRDLTRANEELQQFAYVASHDLQEPLRTITSFTQLIAERYKGQLDEDADEFIGYIVASSRRMTDLINGLLALARLRKSGQPTTPADFEQIVEEAKLNLQASIRENAARVEYGKLPSLIVDKLQFAQVFQNLISNAIKYRREEPPVIRIEARRESTNWIFSVSDNGQGFRQEFAERIFGMFQRLSPQGVVGTGIGLSIARKIVERHGGRIWANSREGEGSTFYFSLPVSLKATRESETEVHAVVEKS